ncbi:Crp/Fnr family transcriptional regulator [Roseivirga pacifica]|uniref:Crp/Fnr family transcriptional regulator n=1 Tax=Roseivirga pacifica TaxID=1267423 RepID=UPI0020951431|nr:Crp/Fnr family transcriptional regulator [Roseivirga pacifica]MCO6358056.1 helix-turn-helix domain-containing protein [Roseivirga pacifica]MCO6366494.1 helix-turn-helix domain-containing protein [Roseivirga pacifica]MCO6370979.1 helix-turn-helix domain-containing protein [Roseivirga pacifica]MCO6373787.1 helix-turn-helix domain-containing protein [Roseivirga pacifica]MCO6380768.1 helix-turn-helix domain-containing protein [Roseivirga pacifica]
MKKIADVLHQLGLEDQLIQEIEQVGRQITVATEQLLIAPGMQAREMPLVLSGTLRVMREDAEGREIFLYYLEGGDACAMSISCCLGTQMSEFKVIAESEATLWMVPMVQIDNWMAKYRSFRKFIFDSYHDRFDEMLNTVDSIAFMNMDQRLMKYLLDKKQSSRSFVINKTHEQIAQELNTSRVVVSRLLKKLEREEKIELHRNRIEVL